MGSFCASFNGIALPRPVSPGKWATVVRMVNACGHRIELPLRLVAIGSAKREVYLRHSIQSFRNTHHPFEAVQASHLRGRVYRCHSVACSNIKRTAGLEYEKLEHLQMSLLCGQVHRRHIVVHLRIGAREGVEEMGK